MYWTAMGVARGEDLSGLHFDADTPDAPVRGAAEKAVRLLLGELAGEGVEATVSMSFADRGDGVRVVAVQVQTVGAAQAPVPRVA